MKAGRTTALVAASSGAMLLIAFAAAVVSAQQPRPNGHGLSALRPARLHAIISDRMFSAYNRGDAIAAFSAWVEIVGRERGFHLDSRADTSSSLGEIRQRLIQESVDILILEITDYLRLERAGMVRPELLGTRGASGDPRYSYVLLAGPAFEVRDWAGLRGKTIHHFSRLDSNTSMAWIELSLAKERLGRAAPFFKEAKAVLKPQDCVLPLFFGRIDACVVDDVNLELLKELNPQLNKLRLLARSVPLVDSVIAAPVKPHPHRQELIEAISGLHQHPRGKQLLMVFKTGRMVPIRPGDLDSARAFWAEYAKLTGETGRVPAP